MLKSPELITPSESIVKTTTNIEFNWKSTDKADYYHIQISMDSTFDNIVLDYNKISSNKFVTTDNLLDTIYFWRVSAYSTKNSSSWSEVRKFRINSVVGVDDSETETNIVGIENYPNPFVSSTNFAFSISKPSLVKLSLYDFAGRIVATIVDTYLQTGSYNYNWNSADLNSGIYYFQLNTGKNIQTGMITKIK
jgi:hypothetical protein